MRDRGRNDELTFGHVTCAMMAGHPEDVPSQHLAMQGQSTGGKLYSRYRFGSHLCKVMAEDTGVCEETKETIRGQQSSHLIG